MTAEDRTAWIGIAAVVVGSMVGAIFSGPGGAIIGGVLGFTLAFPRR